MASTALVVLDPEVEAAVSGVRAQFDPAAQLGVPAHVTLLFPFIPPSEISESVLARLRALFAASAGFSVSFTEVRRWPEQAYLAPQPESPFIALTRNIAAAFPGYPPYEGHHSGIVPHLTFAQGSAAAAERGAKAMSVSLAASGPARSTCTAATLLENSAGVWRTMHTFPLAHRAA